MHVVTISMFVYDRVDDLAEFKFNLLINYPLMFVSQNLGNKC